jgi:translation initiation factor 2B subunit (eIF-2B alpha/beta/delta family)
MTNSSVALGLAIIGADYVLSNGAVIVNPGTVNHEKNDKKKG